MSDRTLTDFRDWTRRVADSRTIPVLITGPVIFQDKRSHFAAEILDSNLANYADFKDIMDGLKPELYRFSAHPWRGRRGWLGLGRGCVAPL
jgi:hypothetical protein